MMEKVLKEKVSQIKPPKLGEIVEGQIIGFGPSCVYLDLGVFGTGIIYGKEFFEAKEVLKDKKIGDKIFAKVVELDGEQGYLELSAKEAGKEIAWEILRQKKEKNESLKVKILKANKGGLLTEISGIPAFLPVSQLSPQHYPRVEGADPQKILRELQKFIGQELEVKIFSLDPKEEKLILSEKIKDLQKIKEALKKYQVSDQVEGEITGVTDFGVFICFGKEKIEGLCHISELDWQLIEDPAKLYKVGDKVKAKIVKIEDDRVFLSIKALKKDPWQKIEKKLKKGDLISGKVKKLNPYGAQVEVLPKIQGLCHISEFGTIKKMEETLQPEKSYQFEILEINPAEHRLILKFVG